MANVTETIQVAALTKYGFQTDKKEYINWSTKLADNYKAMVVPGGSYSMELYVSESGKRYLNSVKEANALQAAESLSKGQGMATTPQPKKKETVQPKKEEMTRADWDLKGEHISRQGTIQAAVRALASVVSLDMLFDEAVKLSDKMLEYVNRK